jgi:hypothetical protein
MRGGKRQGAGRPPGSKNRKTLLRQALGEEALKSGKTPFEVMLDRMRELAALPDSKSKKEACLIASWAAPYIHARLSSQTVNAEVQTRNVIRVPAKANSIEEWLETYKPLVAAGLPKVEEPN